MGACDRSHGERLSAVDTSFLVRESPRAHMHIGAVLTFDGEPPSFSDFRAHVSSRLHLVPRYR